jgi:hypothetical protein
MLWPSFIGLPRQHSYTTGFGAALNIETLVAAAEQRDRPIEVGIAIVFLGALSRGRIHNMNWANSFSSSPRLLRLKFKTRSCL